VQLDRAPNAGRPLSKVPQVALAFWAVKILATTVGETAGDALSMTLKLGYAVSTLIFLALFPLTLTAQIASRLAVGRITSSLALAAGMVVVIALALRRERAPAHASPSTPG
jgi:uncharacterized membrane-anchored protein